MKKKSDVMTLAIIVFLVGVLASSVGFTGVFGGSQDVPPAALQQGITLQ